MNTDNPIKHISAPMRNETRYAIISLIPEFIRKSINGPLTKVPANPQDRKKVVLYTANNLPLFAGGINFEAMA